MKGLALPGLDGSNLLGFLASLGVLEALWSTRRPGAAEPRLGWQHSGTWQPVLTGTSSVEEVASRVLEDSRSTSVEAVLAFRYVKVEKNGSKEVRSLVPPQAVLRAALRSLISTSQHQAAGALASLMCESSLEDMKEERAPSPRHLRELRIEYDLDALLDRVVNQTPFDFTSRNTQFLDQVRRIRDTLTPSAIVDDLFRGLGAVSDRIMRWDARVDMPGSLFERVNPMPRPASEWLAFRGIALYTLVWRPGGVAMSGFSGRRKAGDLSWVLWDSPLTHDVVRTTISQAWHETNVRERTARGVLAGFTVSLRKDATGYDGSVSPSSPLTTR